MALKVLIKRDSVEEYNTTNYIPKEFELVAAYETDTEKVIYKLGDGVTPWSELKEVTKLSELDKFFVYTKNCGDKSVVEAYLNPFMIQEELQKPNDNGTFTIKKRLTNVV